MSLTLSTQKLSALSADGTPSYASHTETRVLRLDRPDEAVLPVFVPSDEEKKLLGISQALLRVRARPATRPPAMDYGTVSVSTDAPRAEVLLDGGLVGHTDDRGNLILPNVSVGDRDLGLRDGAHRFVRVLADQTVGVTIGLSSRHSSSPAKELAPIGPNDRGYDEYRRGRDGAVMVKVPEGEFLMGNLDTEGRPLPHTVYVSAFLMDKTPVTWGQFRKFCEETGWPWPPEPYWGFHDDHPAAYVTWEEGRTYCEWAGGRLPTEAEREKAARGTDGRKFPWGNEEPTPERAVFRHNWGYEASEPVGSHPSGASPYGLLDVGGNMWEWCEDWYDEKYYESSPARNPKGPPTGRGHVVRGGSWDSRPTVLSASCRNWGDIGYREGDFGFRCAADPPP
jgi:formylglycine-generating enzyme required for sulfatase activity